MALDKDLPPPRQHELQHQALVAQLEAVGLELWQSPEGFYAVRVKPALSPAPLPRSRRRRIAR